MKVYYAARATFYEEAREAADKIEAAGHEITCRWMDNLLMFDKQGSLLTPGEVSEDNMRTTGDLDQQGVADAEVLVLNANNDTIYGALIESGMAIAYGHEIIVIAPRRQHVFWTRSEIRKVRLVASLDEALAVMDSLAAAA